MNDKKRIMDMVKEGKLSAEEAVKLLESLDSIKPAPPAPPGPSMPLVTPSARGIARMIRIVVDGEDVKIKVNVPAALAKFASNFIPADAQQQLASQGIDIANILDMLKGELPEGRLVDVEINDMAKMGDSESKMTGPMKVMIEVV